MTRIVPRSAVLGAVVALLTLAGCSSASKPPTATAATPSAVGSSGTGSPAPDPSPGLPGVPGGSIPVIAEQKNLAVPRRSGDAITVGVRSLKVDPNGKTMTLRLVFTPNYATASPGEVNTLGNVTPGFYLLPSLLDRINLKRYDVVRAKDSGGWLTSPSGVGAANGRSFEAWFVYSAPQDPVSTLELSVLDAWPPFTGVPVQR